MRVQDQIGRNAEHASSDLLGAPRRNMRRRIGATRNRGRGWACRGVPRRIVRCAAASETRRKTIGVVFVVTNELSKAVELLATQGHHTALVVLDLPSHKT